MSRLNNCRTTRAFTPRAVEYQRVENFDEDGTSLVSYSPVDLNFVRKSNGSVELWSLSTMLKAGVNPQTAIHTGHNTRLEGLSELHTFEASADAILNSNNDEK